MFVQS